MRKLFLLFHICIISNLFGGWEETICHRRAERGHDCGYSPAGWDDKYRDATDEKTDDGKGKTG